MPEKIPADSVGLVESKVQHFDQPLQLECGKTLERFSLAYETYGELNAKKSNALLIFHALSGNQHAAGYHSIDDRNPGWWDNCIGPGKPFDTDHFFIICVNNLGGCGGSTGPNSINSATSKHYANTFPIVTVADWINSQRLLAKVLGIERFAAVIGGSLGGMQAMQWAIDFPDDAQHALLIASAPKLSAQNIAFNEVARQAIIADSDFRGGDFYGHSIPKKGLMLARMLGHITYLSDAQMRQKFGRELRQEHQSFSFDVEFQVESYLRYQGESFVDRFDANTYLRMTKALDYFDPAVAFDNNLATAFKQTKSQFLVVSFTTDWRFSSARSKEIVKALAQAKRAVSYCEIESPHGHDAFLKPIPQYMSVLHAYMNQVLAGIK